MTPAQMFQSLSPLTVISSVAMPTQAQDVIFSDQVLPDDTYLHVTVRSVKDAKVQFAESPFGRMVNDPALGEFRGELENVLSGPIGEALAAVEAELGLSTEEILNIPSGEVSVSIASARDHVGLVVHVDVGESVSPFLVNLVSRV